MSTCSWTPPGMVMLSAPWAACSVPDHSLSKKKKYIYILKSLISNLDLPWHTLKLFSLILILATWEKRLTPHLTTIMGQSTSSSVVVWILIGHVYGHGYPRACWDLQRSLWISFARAVSAALRSCRWELFVQFGRNYFFEYCQQEALKIN